MSKQAMIAFGLLAVLASQPSTAQVYPSHQRGLSADTAYGHGDVDSINFFNGNLTIVLPIGQSYPVGPSLSYGLTLSYNSNAWDHDIGLVCKDGFGTTYPYSWPKASASDNAGLGWRLSMGRILPGDIYESPDGGQHTFYNRLHPGQSDGTSSYTMDGTYLRRRQQATGCAVASPCQLVEFPDGRVQEFSQVSGEWLLRQTRDRFGNWMRVDYPNANTWSITDVHGRSHTVTLSGGKVVEVELEAFGTSTPASWTFEYDTETIPRRGFKSSCPNVDDMQTVSLLKRVVMPGDHFYDMEYLTAVSTSGALSSLRLPTGGKTEWDFGLYFFTSIDQPVDVEGLPWSSSAGVVERRSYLQAGDASAHGTWTYQSEEAGFGAAPDDQRTTPCWAQTTVTDPEGHETVHYFSTQKAVKSWSYALPFTFCNPETEVFSTTGPFLSQRVYSGSAASGTLLREVFVEYESDGISAMSHQDKNHRLKLQKTVYKDDGDRYQQTAYSDFDGLGNYRTATTSGNFFTTVSKTVTTRFNPSLGSWSIDPDAIGSSGNGGFNMPGASAPWVWNRFTQRIVSEGSGSTRADYCFEPDGFLSWQRQLESTSPGNKDVLTVFVEQGSTGRVAKEKLYGGDTWSTFDNTYSVDSACSQMDLPTVDPVYQVNHAYASGVVASSQAVEPCLETEVVLDLLSQDIDANTGLPSTVYDSAGVATVLVYDALGRLTGERPDDGAWRNYVFTLPTIGSPSQTPLYTVSACANGTTSCGGSPLAWAQSEYDGLGRRTIETVRFPSSTGSTTQSREYVYNALGWKLSESSWGDFSKKTVWSDHDRFGRPQFMTLPGSNPQTEYKYLGERASMRKDRIVTGFSGAETATHTAELKDAFGRLIEVCEGMTNWWNGSCNQNVTNYTYDHQDRLKRVCVDIGSGCSQERLFTFDGRGFLKSEKHPEIGETGNGVTSYTYDPRGNLLTRSIAGDTPGAFALAYRYDKAGRLVRVSHGSDPLKEFFYARTNDGTDLRRGKLVRALRHNHLTNVGPISAIFGQIDFTVSDTYQYRGLDGRVSDKRTAAGFLTGNRVFHLSQTYDPLGNVATQSGPMCAGWPCLGEDPARTVANSYTNGFLTGVTGYATSISYQLGGSLVHEVATANGVTWKQSINTSDRVVRPSKIETTGVGGSQNWTTGVFDYDGVWNIHQMGNAQFKYDVRSRLVEGQVDVGSLLSQQAQFDTFGNITQLTTGGAGLTVPVSSTTNRLLTSGSNTFQYDVAGNLVDSTGGGHQAWGWDPLGVMRTLQATGFSALYVYDANDERILSWQCANDICGTDDSHERWTLRGFGGEVLRAYEGPDTHGLAWEEDFVYRGRQLLATVREGDVLYVHPDHLGSTRQVTNAAGAQVKRHHFYPFGQEASTVADSDIPLKFTGHERDKNVEGRSTLDYMHARFTSVTWARFLSVDPVLQIERAQSTPQLWNRYSLSIGNPIRYVDPSGAVPEGSMPAESCEGFFCTIRRWILDFMPKPQQADSGDANAQALMEAYGEAKEHPVNLAGNVQEGLNEGTASVAASAATAGIVLASNAAGNIVISKIDDIFLNPTILKELTPEMTNLAKIAKEAGYQVGGLGRGVKKGQGLMLREQVAGKATGRIISWHPGGGHHGPEPYWKISSPKGGTVRIGPQF